MTAGLILESVMPGIAERREVVTVSRAGTSGGGARSTVTTFPRPFLRTVRSASAPSPATDMRKIISDPVFTG